MSAESGSVVDYYNTIGSALLMIYALIPREWPSELFPSIETKFGNLLWA